MITWTQNAETWSC